MSWSVRHHEHSLNLRQGALVAQQVLSFPWRLGIDEQAPSNRLRVAS